MKNFNLTSLLVYTFLFFCLVMTGVLIYDRIDKIINQEIPYEQI